MATSGPPGMEWQSYFSNFRSLGDVISGKEKPSTASIILGNAINAMAGGPTSIGQSFGGGQPMFGGPAPTPEGAVPSPTVTTATPAPVAPVAPGQPQQFAPQVNGQPMMTQPQVGAPTQQQPLNQTPSYSRFLFSPK